MADDSHGLGIPLPADSTPIYRFPGVARDMGEKIAEILSGDIMPEGMARVAAEQVRKSLEDADILMGDDERLPMVLPDRTGWAHVDIDNEGNVIAGVRNDGTRYIRMLESPGTLAGTDERLPQPMTAITGWEHIEVDGAGNIIAGTRTDGTRYIRRLETEGQEQLGPDRIAVYGDSMAGDHGGTGVSFASALAELTGLEVHRGGVPGQTSTEAALRQGGLDVFLTVSSNRIPADGTVTVTAVLPSGVWKTGSAWSFIGSLAGVPGTLRKDAADAWTFTRSTPGNATECKPETRWVSEGRTRSGWIQIFRAGKNSTVPATVRRDAQAFVAGLDGDNNRYLILPVYNSTTEPAGSTGYQRLAALNADHEATHGPHYYDLRGWLIRHGLAAAGLTPTAEDRAAIAEDCIPPSLMLDNTHLTALGRRIEAARIVELLTAKGWLKA